ncbi:hypothetical protein CASFOL_031540 [Castilleja foliolosa]|uniref:RING-type domain-containing protein n=1 Tax=Castilleja foliolosa TaxID=1961234 RepID=A0ABD3C7Y1_9LAMI
MSPQKRPLETTTATPPSSPPPPLEVEEDADGSPQGSENQDLEQAEKASDSDSSSYSSDGEIEEYINVKLGDIRKEVQCPICLGIIRKTRTVMECLHRFCRECIDKSMRLGNNECPACRTHCASRRSLRDDPNYDALIAALYPDIDKYEEEELAFHEEEKARNKQIQASIAQTSRRQAEALGKKRASIRATSSTYARRQGNYRNVRARKNYRVVEHQGSDEEEGANEHDGSRDSSSSDDHSVEVKPKRYKKRPRASQQSSGANADGGDGDGHDSDRNKDLLVSSARKDFLGWGRGGLRSSLRNSGPNCANSRLSRNNRLSKLINYLQCSHENDELKISIMIVSLNEDKIPSLKRPYLSCSPTSSVATLCQHVAMQTSVEASVIDMLTLKDSIPIKYTSDASKEPAAFDPSNHELQLLNGNQTLGEIYAEYNDPNLVLAYRLKEQGGEGNGN